MKTVSVNSNDFRLLGRAETLSELTVRPDLMGFSLKKGVRWMFLTIAREIQRRLKSACLWSVLLRRDTVGDELGAGAYVQAFHH